MRSLALVFLALFSSSVHASDSLESKLGFRLTSPGAEWRLLDEDSVRELQPRAVAGLVFDQELYNVVVVELEEGPFFHSNVIDCDNDDIHVGMPVEVVFEKRSDLLTLPLFRPRREP